MRLAAFQHGHASRGESKIPTTMCRNALGSLFPLGLFRRSSPLDLCTVTEQHAGCAILRCHREQVLTVDTAAWFAWLETASTFSFVSETGSLTARREQAGHKRGGWYWKAYRKQHGKLTSRYLGKSETLTLAHLQTVAQALAAALIETAPDTDAGEAHPSEQGTAPGMRSDALTPRLSTKLHRPLPRAHLVRRPQLAARLTQGVLGPLTLVSAPAGFGKTTLLAQWLAESDMPVAWLSLEPGDSEPVRFLSYLIAALQTLDPHLGAEALTLLQMPRPAAVETVLTLLTNDVGSHGRDEGDFVLVLDDYHALDATPIDQALTYLVEHLPPHMHLVIATREDPPLPLARLRARGHLTEVRATDLRFTPSEAAEFLSQAMGLSLEAQDIARLATRTEGWIAGLQLAALSLQGQEDAAGFIRSFTGSHHFVLDYLVEEVLGQQDARLQSFLLRTSILDRMTGPLCDAVLMDPSVSGQETLEYIERANLFLVPLDNERHWYRYHQLFADLLQQRLHQSVASSTGDERKGVAELHTRASQWYEENGFSIEAFQHAVAANDVARAERLIEGEGVPLHFRGAGAPVRNWLESLPAAVLNARPSLWVAYASALMTTGQTTAVEQRLQAAETAMPRTEPDDRTRDLVGRIASMRATLAVMQHDAETIVTQSRRALEYLDPDNLPLRTASSWTLGYAYQLQGDRAAASRAYTEVIAISASLGDSIYTTAATTCLGQVQEADNQLYTAAETYRRALILAGDPPQRIACEAHLGLARIYYQWNDLDAAGQHGQQCLQLTQQIDSVDTLAACWVLLARLKLVKGDVVSATALLAKAEQFVCQQNFAFRMPDVTSAQVLTLLRQGSLSAAAHLAQTHDLPISQARVHLAQGDPSTALARLLPVRQQAEAKGWADERLQVMILQAVALHMNGEKSKAVQLICDALALAAPGGFIRLFVDEGPPAAHLLSIASARGLIPDYTGKLLAVLEADAQQRENTSSLPSPAQPLTEPLSPRELEVLHLMAQGLSNQEMCERLFLALSTVKGHNRTIFGKLQVQRRTEAVARARGLGLL
jgi:LuxR family transcriptional regulator, maltose regulon positive regulatory protein